MGKKYLDTKEGSLEQSILSLWQEAAGVKKEKLDPVGKEDGDIDNDGDKDSSDKYLMKRRKAIKKSMSKKEGNAFGMALKSAKDNGEKTFVVSGKKYNVEDYDVKEDVDLDEASVMVDLENDDKKLMSDIKKMGIKVKDLGDSGNRGYNEYKLTGSPAALKKGGKKFGWDQQVEKVQVKEGKMSQLHQLIKDKKSAEEISKIMRLDLKSVKALMSGYGESYEWGTDELRKHTEDVTPGQDGDWVDAQKGKNDSMRETLAKVWGFTEDKNPFKKESKKDLTKEVKDGKTMTGKKVASVEMKPKIQTEKKK